MKQIIALLFPILLGMTVDVSCHQMINTEDQERKQTAVWLDSKFGEDTAKIQVKYIFDLFQLFSKQTIEKSYADWIRNHRPFEPTSEVINSTNITFTEFIPDDEILPISLLYLVECTFRQKLTVQFKPTESHTIIKGNANFFHPDNISLCRVFLNFSVVRVVKEFAMQNLDTTINESAEIVLEYFTRYDVENFQIMKVEGKLCEQNINPKQIADYAHQAINNIIKERFQIVVASVFESMLNNCLYPLLDEDNSDYSLFKLEPNLDEFPWNSDYNELNITGLNHIFYLKVNYSKSTASKYYVILNNINIQWNIIPLTIKKPDFGFDNIIINSLLKIPLDYAEINLERIAQKSSFDHFISVEESGISGIATGQLGIGNLSEEPQMIFITVPECSLDYCSNIEERRELAILMLMGIEQTFQRIRYDGTREFTNTFQVILAPFDRKIFENLSSYAEKTPHINSFASFSNIKMKAYDSLENITCTIIDNGNQKIGTIIYKNVKARANFLHAKKTFDGYEIVQESAIVYIKQVNFDISLERNSNQANKITVKINDSFEMADITISLDDNFPRKSRISYGKAIFEDVVKLFRDRIDNAINFAFNPFFNTCTQFADSRQYYAFIRGQRVHSAHLPSIRSVDVLINGTWNFKDINARYVNGSLIFDGLRMEKVRGSIKLWKGSNESAVLNYAASYLSLIIDHENTTVKVKVPGGLKLSNFHSKADEILEIFETAVAHFIARSIYDESMKYHSKYQMLASKTIREMVQRDTPLMYDKTLVFVDNIVKTLKNIPSQSAYNGPVEIPLQLERQNTSFNLSNLQSRFFVDFGIRMIVKKYCDDFVYSQNTSSVGELCVLSGNITIREGGGSGNQLSSIHFETEDYRMINISSNKNEYEDSKQLEIFIDDTNMTIDKDLRSYEEDILKEKFTEIATELVKKIHYENFLSSPNICFHRFGNSVPSENHFYLITNTINTATQNLLTYHIKLYGLYNLSDLLYQSRNDNAVFFIRSGNLTVHIITISSSLIRKEIELQVDEIELYGGISKEFGILSFKNISKLNFSYQNIGISPRFLERLNKEIMNSIKNLVKVEYFRNQFAEKQVGTHMDHSYVIQRSTNKMGSKNLAEDLG